VARTMKARAAGASSGRQPGADARSRARERIAAQQAARRRAELRRRLLIAVGSVTAVLAGVVRQATTVPAAVLARARAGPAVTALEPIRASGPPLTTGGKPAIVFVGEESCPFCAAERWALVGALSQFGTWTHLGATTSSAADVYPDTATFSFRTAGYRSAQLALRTTELADSAGRPLQPQTALDTRLIGTYDVPPYVNSAGQSGAVPFLDIANRYVLAGAQYDPRVLAGLSAAQIAGQLRNPASPVARAIDGSARVIVAAIRSVLQDTPGHA
jgi:hypothetical protein